MYQQSVSLTDKLLFVPALLDRSGPALISCFENLTTSNQQSVDASVSRCVWPAGSPLWFRMAPCVNGTICAHSENSPGSPFLVGRGSFS